MKISALTQLEHNAHRVGEIMGVAAKYGLADRGDLSLLPPRARDQEIRRHQLQTIEA
jgi:hypothetical protein